MVAFRLMHLYVYAAYVSFCAYMSSVCVCVRLCMCVCVTHIHTALVCVCPTPPNDQDQIGADSALAISSVASLVGIWPMCICVQGYMAQVLFSLSVFTFSTIRVNVFLAGFAHLCTYSVHHEYFFRICLWEGLGWLVDKCQFIILQLPPILHLIKPRSVQGMGSGKWSDKY